MTETQGLSSSPRLAAQTDGSKSGTSGSGRRDVEHLPQPVLQELSGLTIGMWKSRTHESLYLLVLPSAFVFVVEVQPVRPKAAPRKTSFNSPRLNGLNTLNKSINTSLSASPILKQFVSASPFSRGQQPSTGTTVFAFEVKFGSVAGVDFQVCVGRRLDLFVLSRCRVVALSRCRVVHLLLEGIGLLVLSLGDSPTCVAHFHHRTPWCGKAG